MKRVPLHLQILVAMVLGAVLGLSLNAMSVGGRIPRELVLQLAGIGEWFGKIFLALLQMVVVPLIFSSLVASVTGVGKRAGIGRLGARTAIYYLMTSVLAIGTGLVLVNLVRPGEGLDYEALMVAAQSELQASSRHAVDPSQLVSGNALTVLVDIVYRMIPQNVVSAASDNRSILAVIFFALLFGVFTVRTGGEHERTMTRFFVALQDVMMNMTQGILTLAPLGILGYVFYVTAATGLSLASALGWYMLTVALGLLFHALLTLPAILWATTRRHPLEYFRAMSEALATAFSTASSAGTLPLTMRCATEKGGVPHRISSFTLPLGATVNMDGTALYEVVAVLFVAQMLGNLSLGQQLIVAFTALLASIGAAGIPHAGTVMMVIVMQAVGLPTDAVLVILAVDRVLDMGRTTVNVWSDSICAAVVSHYDQVENIRPLAPPDDVPSAAR